MLIQQATLEDIAQLQHLFTVAKNYMISSGNPYQWGKDYPSFLQIQSDITAGHCQVITCNDKIVGTFCAITGKDATYTRIDDGAWINDILPYTTIHRIASDGSQKGIFSTIINWCEQQWNNLRIDTHHDNHTMLHLIEKHGFKRCGIIYTQNQSPRIAFQRLT